MNIAIEQYCDAISIAADRKQFSSQAMNTITTNLLIGNRSSEPKDIDQRVSTINVDLCQNTKCCFCNQQTEAYL
jgi:hypothetical protein